MTTNATSWKGAWTWLVKNLPAISAFSGAAIWLIMQFAQAQATERRVDKLEDTTNARIGAIEQARVTDHDTLIEIRNDVKWIKERAR